MGHTLTEAEALAQVVHAETAYMEGADGLAVQDDLDTRKAQADAAHTPRNNDQLDPTHVHVRTNNVSGLKSYSGGNVVNAAEPDALRANDFQKLVRIAIDQHHIFAKGGETHDFQDGSDLVNHLDPMFLAEAAKMTAEKPF